MMRKVFFLASLLIAGVSHADTEGPRTPLNVWSEASSGDQFYIEMRDAAQPAVVLDAPIDSKMPGSMGFRFRFAIDTTTLLPLRQDAKYQWYAAPPDKARAWHGMLGTVLADGDTVGLRIPKDGSTAQWFVDNSNHNGFSTVWKRKHNPKKDPAYRRGKVDDPDRASWRALTYQGQRDGQLVIEMETGEDGVISKREYLYPITTMPMEIGMQGLRAEISEVDNVGIRIRVVKGFAVIPFAMPTIDQSASPNK